MRITKSRLTVTIDPHLVKAGQAAVAAGQADTFSAWVNAALTEQATRQRRLDALGDAIASYEAEFGVITAEELTAQAKADRPAARVVRSRQSRPAKSRRRGAA